ncbi:hypothetical protein LCGC14_1564110 [marine sediment metagenome]|uniref:Recombination endonuclease VII n=1 Tax=marine sediment metagenome TaxID=412755 RepID=A0A0F9LM65_9ZZZZ
MLTKKCTKCESKWPADLDHYYKDQSKKDNLSSSCKRCHKIYDKNCPITNTMRKIRRKAKRKYKRTDKGKEAEKRYVSTQKGRDANKKASRKHSLKKRYRLSLSEFELMRKKQRGKCMICGMRPALNLCVDHNHKTGKVRGLLCHPCNLALGRLEKYFDSFKKYLRRYR